MTRPLSVDLFGAAMVSDPRANKAGTVVFTKTVVDRAQDAYLSTLVLHRRGFKALTKPCFGIGSAAWSPTGSRLAFVRRSKIGSIFRTTIEVFEGFGEPLEVYAEDNVKIAGLRWMDEHTLIFLKDVVNKSTGDEKKIFRIRYRLDGEGYFHDRNKHLFFIRIGKKARQLTSGDYDVMAFDLDRESKKLYFVSNLEPDRELSITKKVYEIGFEGGSPSLSVDWPGMISAISVSGSGRVAFLGHDLSHGISTNVRLNLLTSKGVETLTKEFDRSLENSLNSDLRPRQQEQSLRWSHDGRRLYFLYTDRSINRLGEYSLDISTVTPIDTGELSPEGFDITPDTLWFSASSWDQTADLFKYSFEEGRVKRVTAIARRSVKRWDITRPEKVSVRVEDGRVIDGWFIRSKVQPAKGTVLEIHGGPRTAYGELLMFEFQFLAARGFNVAFCNPRGSSGYGQEFADAVVGHYGEADYRDIMSFFEYVVNTFSQDRSRLYVTGGSYGGFMTNWIVAHTDLFRAAVTQRSISNWVSFYGTSDIGYYFTRDQIGSSPWEGLDVLWEKSPLRYARNIKTPLLIHHAEEDYRCPIEQAEQLFTALRELGREAVLVSVPEEGHELSRSGKPSRRIHRLEEIAGWFELHQ
jgi:dipeptidyl aminopeptidase/acylaminoacyl peptidase